MSVKTAQPQPTSPTLMDSLQAEVSKEASPLLELLARNTTAIIVGFVCFILGIGGYWLYSGQAKKAVLAEQREIGRFLSMTDHAKRLAELEAYLPNSSEAVRTQAYFAIAESALATSQYEKAYDAWAELKKRESDLKMLATIGMGHALGAQKKYKEAIAVLDEVLPEAKGTNASNINEKILALAVLEGNTQRAIAACEALLADVTAPENKRSLWVQQLAELRMKAEGSK